MSFSRIKSTGLILVKRIAGLVLWLEPMLLAIIAFAFWFPTPTRTDWIWLLALLIPVYIARGIVHGRLLTRTPLDVFFLAFLLLGVLNVWLAPYTRGLMMLARPVLGMAIYYAMIERARIAKSMDGPIGATTLLALLVGLLAILGSQWTNKGLGLTSLTRHLPSIENFPGLGSGFNVNEIAGALSWLTPLMAGMMILYWQERVSARREVTLAFCLLFAALILGQSRLAVIGVLPTMIVMTLFLIKSKLWRWLWVTFLTLLLGLQLFGGINLTAPSLTTLNSTQNTQSSISRDDLSLSIRIDIWTSVIEIIQDRPLTGVGMSMFRDDRVREQYPVPSYPLTVLPHAHNEFIQITTDMGLPGLAVLFGIFLTTSYMLILIWRHGDFGARVIAVSLGGGLIAHVIFGLGDAIPFWDRLAFIFWVLLGVIASQYQIVFKSNE